MSGQAAPALLSGQFTLLRMFHCMNFVAIMCSALVALGQLAIGVDVSWRILATTLIVVLAYGMVMACGVAHQKASSERKDIKFISIVGITLTSLSALIASCGLWDISLITGNLFIDGLVLAFASIYAFALTHIALLSLARLTPRLQVFYQLNVIVTLAVATSLSGMLILSVCGGRYLHSVVSSDGPWRLIACAAIVDVMLTLLIPLLHLVSRKRREDGKLTLAEIDEEIERLELRLSKLNELRGSHMSPSYSPAMETT